MRLNGRIVSICIVLLLVALTNSNCYASKTMHSNGAIVDGKLQEYDQNARDASKMGFDKNGFYIEPSARYEYESGMSEEKFNKWDSQQPSYYFNKDGTPKSKDVFLSDEDYKRIMGHYPKNSPKYAADEAAMKEAAAIEAKEWAEKEAKQRALKEEWKKKKAASDAEYNMFIYILLGIPLGIWICSHVVKRRHR